MNSRGLAPDLMLTTNIPHFIPCGKWTLSIPTLSVLVCDYFSKRNCLLFVLGTGIRNQQKKLLQLNTHRGNIQQLVVFPPFSFQIQLPTLSQPLTSQLKSISSGTERFKPPMERELSIFLDSFLGMRVAYFELGKGTLLSDSLSFLLPSFLSKI